MCVTGCCFGWGATCLEFISRPSRNKGVKVVRGYSLTKVYGSYITNIRTSRTRERDFPITRLSYTKDYGSYITNIRTSRTRENGFPNYKAFIYERLRIVYY